MPQGQPDQVKEIHNFLKVKFESLDSFKKEDLKSILKNNNNFNTYWSKKVVPLLVSTNKKRKTYRVSEYFRRYLDYEQFSKHWSQSAKYLVKYTPDEKDYMSFQLFLPLANELVLRDALDALFYLDRLKRRVKTISIRKLKKWYKINTDESNQCYLERISKEISNIFGGYSVHHVNGRFRGEEILTYEEAAKIVKEKNKNYLYDETTAVIRFIVPLSNETSNQKETMERIRWLFMAIFVRTILESINGEAEIWLMESGVTNKLYTWSRQI